MHEQTAHQPSLRLGRLFGALLFNMVASLFSSHFDRCEHAAMWLVSFIWKAYAEAVVADFLSMSKSDFLLWKNFIYPKLSQVRKRKSGLLMTSLLMEII